ncbi:glycerophosphodiester phosphodiesterase family protein [Roseibium marinum]|uniref:Glycerophosphoryl diester phosphodiesterase n=1 Tax=Roseibium marinum TaxID=281252 RepID=A0A2S3USA5_9HYPH|nr:glycerophosphodiester phosphodiesterase family protein [Roseibium marinum]POF30544.1 glycerophosphoryl diester phosphodiesterase [Roseibium marinum]
MTIPPSSSIRPPLKKFLADRTWPLAVIAHRGAWHGAPENSLASVELAIRNGYDFVEIDVQTTADGGLICLHDDTLERMTGRSGQVARSRTADLADLRLKDGAGGDGAAFSSHAPAFLEDLLSVSAGNIYVDIDVKHLRDMDAVGHILRDHPYRSHLNLKMLVQDEQDLRRIDALEASAGVLVKPILRLSPRTLPACLELLRQRPTPLVETLFDDWDCFVPFAKAARLCGTDMFLNTLDAVPSADVTDTLSVKDPDRGWGRLVAHGVRLVQTDRPQALKAYASTL